MKLPEDSELIETYKISLKGIDLEDSWLLEVIFDEENHRLSFILDFSIWPESKYYTYPNPGEWTCYRKGKMNFNKVKEITGLVNLDNIEPSIDPQGEKDWGNIYRLRIENGRFAFELEEHEMTVQADELEIEIN